MKTKRNDALLSLVVGPPSSADVRALLRDDALFDRIAADVFREYNTTNMITAELPVGTPGAGSHK